MDRAAQHRAETIRFYGAANAHGYLSNFYPAPFQDTNGRSWPTVEHAFQAMKTLDEIERERIRLLVTPGLAKQAGRRVKLRPGWDDMRVSVMERLVEAKFRQNPDLAAQLAATGEAQLIEAAPRDWFWGCGADGSGRNELGLALMRLRDQLTSAVS